MLEANVRLYTGNANKALANKVAWYLNRRPDKITIEKFNDSEIRIAIPKTVRGNDAFIIQPTCHPVNDNLMEVLLLADALRRSGNRKIVACMPYYGYSRQDRKPDYSRVPISASLVAKMIEAAGISHLITMDLHATQIEGFFSIPVDNISACQLFISDIYKKYNLQNIVIVSPDVGGVGRARSLAKQLDNAELAIIDKRRPEAGKVVVMNVIGDIEGKTCIIVDDIADTCGTLTKGVEALLDNGAKEVIAYITHGVLSGKAYRNLEKSNIKELIVTDSILVPEKFLKLKNFRQISIATLLGETISRVSLNQSVSSILE